MAVAYFSDAPSCLQEGQPFMQKHKAENSALFGIFDRLQAGVFTLTSPLLAASMLRGHQVDPNSAGRARGIRTGDRPASTDSEAAWAHLRKLL